MKIIFRISLLLILLIATVVIAIFNPIGQRYISKFIADKIKNATTYQIDVENISFRLPLALNIEAVNVADQEGKWLVINDLKISLLPTTALFQKNITFEDITVDEIKLLRFPIPSAADQSQLDGIPITLNYDVHVNKLNLKKINIYHNNDTYTLSLNSELDFRRSSQNLTFNSILEMGLNNLNIEGNYNLGHNLLKLDQIFLRSNYSTVGGTLTSNLSNYETNAHFTIENGNVIEDLAVKLGIDIFTTHRDSNLIINTNIEGNIKYDSFEIMRQENANLEISYNSEKKLGQLSFALDNRLKASLALRQVEKLLKFEHIEIEDKYKDSLMGSLDFNLANNLIEGELALKASNLNKLYPNIKGAYKSTLKLKSEGRKQIFNLDFQGQKIPDPIFSSIDAKLLGSLDINTQDNILLNLDKIYIHTGKTIIKNKEPVIIERRNKNIIINQTELNVNQGYVNFSGSIKDEKIDMQVNVNSNLDYLLSLFIPANNQVKGRINSVLKIDGKLGKPYVSGVMNIYDANYKNLKLGLELRKVSVEVDIQDNKISTKYCKFSDIKGNVASCAVNANLRDNNQDFTVNINAANFYLLLPTIGTSGIINTELALAGNKTSAQLSGNIKINSAEIKIPEHFGPSVPKLNIIEKNNIKAEQKPNPYQFNIDIRVSALNKIFVRGFGLDIELKGDLKLANSEDDFLVNGTLSTIRGRYQEFGKYFEIKKGDLVFQGTIPPSPYLHVIGTTAIGDTQVNLELAGPMLNPKLSIYSNPPSSQEEALSLILFGQKSDNISALQAISLANSLKKLSGYGDSGLEVMGKVRKILHVDDITVSSEEGTGKTKVGVGKYLSDKLYLRIEKGVDASAGKTRLEYEIKPSFTIEGEVSEAGDSSVGINWKKDY